jgi:tetratricopeptide (TPR) repeat protein
MVKDTISVMESAEDILDKISYDQNSKIRSDIDMCLGRQVELRGIEGREIGLLRKQRGVSIRQKMLDEAIEHNKEDEIRLWNAKADLAVSYLQDERFDDAGAIMEQAVLQYHKWGTEAEFPFEHAKWFNHYAFVRLWQRRPDEAIEMARHGVELQTIACGVDGSLTLMKRFFMAHMLYIAGRMDEALEVNKMVLEDQIRALGEASFYTLQSMAFYGMLLYEVKYLDEAEYAISTRAARESALIYVLGSNFERVSD